MENIRVMVLFVLYLPYHLADTIRSNRWKKAGKTK